MASISLGLNVLSINSNGFHAITASITSSINHNPQKSDIYHFCHGMNLLETKPEVRCTNCEDICMKSGEPCILLQVLYYHDNRRMWVLHRRVHTSHPGSGSKLGLRLGLGSCWDLRNGSSRAIGDGCTEHQCACVGQTTPLLLTSS